MQGDAWLVSCGCGADEEFVLYADARRWQDLHAEHCGGPTDLWAPEVPAEALPPALPLAAAPQALSAARA